MRPKYTWSQNETELAVTVSLPTCDVSRLGPSEVAQCVELTPVFFSLKLSDYLLQIDFFGKVDVTSVRVSKNTNGDRTLKFTLLKSMDSRVIWPSLCYVIKDEISKSKALKRRLESVEQAQSLAQKEMDEMLSEKSRAKIALRDQQWDLERETRQSLSDRASKERITSISDIFKSSTDTTGPISMAEDSLLDTYHASDIARGLRDMKLDSYSDEKSESKMDALPPLPISGSGSSKKKRSISAPVPSSKEAWLEAVRSICKVSSDERELIKLSQATSETNDCYPLCNVLAYVLLSDLELESSREWLGGHIHSTKPASRTAVQLMGQTAISLIKMEQKHFNDEISRLFSTVITLQCGLTADNLESVPKVTVDDLNIAFSSGRSDLWFVRHMVNLVMKYKGWLFYDSICESKLKIDQKLKEKVELTKVSIKFSRILHDLDAALAMECVDSECMDHLKNLRLKCLANHTLSLFCGGDFSECVAQCDVLLGSIDGAMAADASLRSKTYKRKNAALLALHRESGDSELLRTAMDSLSQAANVDSAMRDQCAKLSRRLNDQQLSDSDSA